MNIGKVLLIFFEGNEEKVIDSIISVLGVGREKFAFQQMYSNSEVNYKDIIFDFKRREVVKVMKKRNLHIQSLKSSSFSLKIPAGYSVRSRYTILFGMNRILEITIL